MWQETDNNHQPSNANMTDVVFRINCARLPVDHAAALAQAVCDRAPELKQSKRAGIHPIHVAGSQNGWERPAHLGDYLLLSKRTRFKIRIDVESAASLISSLSGVTLDVDGSALQIVSGQARALMPVQTLFTRNLYFEGLDTNIEETMFVEQVIDQCGLFAFSPTKILCGREHTVNTPKGPRLTRSVLLADVPVMQSLQLQENGLGDGRTMGCGIFIPHKDTGAVNEVNG